MTAEKFSQKGAPEKNAAEKTPPAFTIWQNHLANGLGISEEELRIRRKRYLTEGIHYCQDGRRKLYSAAGEARLRETLCIPLQESDVPADSASTLPEQTPAAGGVLEQNERIPAVTKKTPLLLGNGKPAVSLVIVSRSAPQITNPHIVEARVPGTDENKPLIVRIRVTSNKNFVVGMEVPVRLIQEPDLYECTRPCPRGRGRW